ncbi:hypothetical protein G5V65_11335 [Rhodobacter sp. HX-7-19]|uniref:Uncharacterized protein n=1 Tax=Paragemmobacter kunshanensis TaxID=2583234 RepID=A0A6M1TTQ6_9RHOB|nr:hypothetical protein [Rhodobacter kunshanensis]NGQ91490.1 hypothetical protein [Rhodobacter kunshanensis]
MSDPSEKYYVVEFMAFAFETKEQAGEFADKLTDAFCSMPEAEGYGASSRVKEVLSDD